MIELPGAHYNLRAKLHEGTEKNVPLGTAVHERTLKPCESLNYREWSGYYTVSAYETRKDATCGA